AQLCVEEVNVEHSGCAKNTVVVVDSGIELHPRLHRERTCKGKVTVHPGIFLAVEAQHRTEERRHFAQERGEIRILAEDGVKSVERGSVKVGFFERADLDRIQDRRCSRSGSGQNGESGSSLREVEVGPKLEQQLGSRRALTGGKG